MAGYIGSIPVPQATQNRETFTATASQTSFATGGHQSGYLDVFMNGVKLVDGSDYTATNGSDVVLATGAAVNDIIEVVSYSAFEVLNQNFTGTTVVDDLTVGGNVTFGDNNKAIFGGELEIYSDATHARIREFGSGQLKIQGDNMQLLTTDGASTYLEGTASTGAVTLYHASNAPRVATTSFGAQITGSLAVDTITNASSSTDVTIDTNFDIILDAGGGVGIGTSSPSTFNSTGGKLAVASGAGNVAALFSDATYYTLGIKHSGVGSEAVGMFGGTSGSGLALMTNNTERMRIASDGTVFIGKTSADLSLTGIQATSSGQAFSVTRDGGAPFALNRKSSDGEIAGFYKDTVKTGAIGVQSSDLVIYSSASGHEGLRFGNGAIVPTNNTGVSTDNACNLGGGGGRFTDIYATNGTIQTSDQNEKQQIASLTDTEMTAAKAISALYKTFKWNDSVADKGDAARTHTGVIAQDVEQAMTDAGLDAGEYAFFISATWWETQTEVPAVEAVEAVYEDVVIPAVLDDDGNEVEAERTEQRLTSEAVEAKDAYTRTDTYDTDEEAPDGATERNRKGIRYPELLAFVGAATEQRLASIETRLTALEAE